MKVRQVVTEHWRWYNMRPDHVPIGSAVVSTKLPDATAFAARFLAHPDDRLGRLVFADWLDEQGGEANLLWAKYLRYRIHANEDFDGVSEQRADAVGKAVLARLLLQFVPKPTLLPWLTAFLPSHRIWVRIGAVRIPKAVWGDCPESVAREHVVMPIAVHGQTLYFTMAAAQNDLDWLRARLGDFFNRPVVLFCGDRDDVGEAINAHYQHAEVECVDVQFIWSEAD